MKTEGPQFRMIIEGVRCSAENADTITGVSCIIPKGLLKNDQNTITKDSSKQDVMGYRKAVSAQDATEIQDYYFLRARLSLRRLNLLQTLQHEGVCVKFGRS
jgi:hypothetical protein